MTADPLSGIHIRACAVKAIAREDSAASAALFALASNGRTVWTLPEWKQLLADLDSSSLTVADWLAARADWI